MIPQLIRDKVNSLTPLVRRLDGPVCVGDVRRVESGGEQRLVVVLKIQQDRSNAQVTIIHPYYEYATSADVVVQSSVSDVPFPMVVQAGMRGVVWLNDLGPLITSVPSEVVAICLSPAKLVPTGAGLSSGPPLTGPLDARSDFKNSECESLSRLCADCTSSALEEEVAQ
jgi:hypothetical protein